MTERTILHADLDAFYASVEQRDDPALRGKPVLVGGDSLRGVVCAASYEARRFGAKSAMPMGEAKRRCPHAIVVRPRMGHYAEVSSRFFGILRELSPLVEGLSLDEAFLDVTGEERLLGDGEAIAQRLKQRVRAELELVVSVGVAPSKYVAKVASDLKKPDGLCVVRAPEVRQFLAPLPVGRLWGVGAVTEEMLRGLGLRTVGDVAAAGESLLARRLTKAEAAHLVALARGEDDRPVVNERAPVSVGNEDTFERDLHSREALHAPLLGQADSTSARARDLGVEARTITIKIKYGDHTSVTRRTTLERPTADGRVIGKTALALLDEVPAIELRGVRLTGVSLSGLVEKGSSRQLLFDEAEVVRGEHLSQALDKITARFGHKAVHRALLLDGPERLAAPLRKKADPRDDE